MPIRSTHTYAILEISRAAYDEIEEKIRDAGYAHAIQSTPDGPVIDMDGIAVKDETGAEE